MLQCQIIILQLVAVLQFCSCLYLKPSETTKFNENTINKDNDVWSIFKQKLGLTDEKVELLKSQTNQQATMELLNRFIKENPEHITLPVNQEEQKPNPFLDVYHSIVNQLKQTKSTLKTSLNFELADKPLKNLKRSRRKIAVKMTSDMPSEKIDYLLEMFNQQHGIDSNESETEDQDDAIDYTDEELPIPTAMGSDYVYDNIHDQEDLGIPIRSHGNSEYASFQELIMQASRHQWRRDREETKLYRNNEHFI